MNRSRASGGRRKLSGLIDGGVCLHSQKASHLASGEKISTQDAKTAVLEYLLTHQWNSSDEFLNAASLGEIIGK